MTKQITTEQLENVTWEIESIEVGDHNFDEHEVVVGLDRDGEWEQAVEYNSWLCGTCTLRAKEFPSMTYVIDWMAQGGKDTLDDAYDFEVEFNETGENELELGDYVAVDADGDEADDAEQIVRDAVNSDVCWEHEVKKHLPAAPVPVALEETDEDSDMDTITVERDNDADLRFQGEQIASASSYHFEGSRNIRWTELTLYKTAGGKLVAEEVGRTRWQGERTRYSAYVAESSAELVEQMGYGWLAKELYDAAGIDYAVEIE